jgi:serine/threonine protein kinase
VLEVIILGPIHAVAKLVEPTIRRRRRLILVALSTDIMNLDAEVEARRTWPREADEWYRRVEVLGKGSFGMVWMAQKRETAKGSDDDFSDLLASSVSSTERMRRRALAAPAGVADDSKIMQGTIDDEFVAIKTIRIKDEKAKVYAEREIRILQEIHHPNIIRLIKAFPVSSSTEANGSLQHRLVILQLARGPNLHQLIVKRGAIGLPLTRLLARQLIAAVSYLHGRAVIHRDIKPSNCKFLSPAVPSLALPVFLTCRSSRYPGLQCGCTE